MKRYYIKRVDGLLLDIVYAKDEYDAEDRAKTYGTVEEWDGHDTIVVQEILED